MSWITPQDLVIIAFLIFLEGILSIDNALVLAMLARPLPKDQQRKALTYGLWGAIVFRLIATFSAVQLMKWVWVKFIGGAYLLFIAIKHFVEKKTAQENPHTPIKKRGFWQTVIMIELMDIAFAVDSILAAVSLTQKLWLVFVGGFLGVVLMRFAANIFIDLLNKFPNLETTAYLLVAVIGIKVILEGLHLPQIDFHSLSSPAFWIFWSIMVSCILLGFKKKQP